MEMWEVIERPFGARLAYIAGRWKGKGERPPESLGDLWHTGDVQLHGVWTLEWREADDVCRALNAAPA